jgi:hypothetical protein
VANDGLTFKLFGEDVSATSAMEKLPKAAEKSSEGVSKAFKGMAAGAAAAVGAAAIGDAITGALDTEDSMAKFKAQLGKSAKTADELGTLAGELYADGWGENLDEVTTAMRAVGDQGLVSLTDDSLEQIGKITGYAQTLADTFGIDVVESSRAAGQMILNGMAPDAETAFDIITTGFQNGADRSGDFLDTLTEYGPHFQKLGIDGPTAVGMITAGLDNGIFTADLAADAFKEFAIRSIDGSKLTGEAYATLGLNADDMAARIAAGGPTATTATGEIMTALGAMTDPIAQQTVGVALFGTQWEDSGARSILAMNPVTTKTVEVKDATKKMGDTLYDTANNKVEVIKRKFDGWIQSMVNTDGPMGTVAGYAVAFGPQFLALAGSVAMIAMAFGSIVSMAGPAIVAIGSVLVAAAPLVAVVAAIATIIQFVRTQLPGIKTQLDNFNNAQTVGDKARSLVSVPFSLNGVQTFSTGARNVPAYNAPGYKVTPMRAMATGGVVMPQRGGAAVKVAEAGEPEAVIPLSKWEGMNGGGGPTVVIQMGSGVIFGTAAELAQRIADIVATERRRGTIQQGAFS